MSEELQRTDKWRQDRAGKITASRFSDVLAMTEEKICGRDDPKKGLKKGDIIPPRPLESRNKYMRELAFERLAGIPRHEVTAKSLTYGKEVEESARDYYQLKTGYFVDQSEFILHQQYDFVGCSPDGLIDEDGGLEGKCPHDEAVHILTWLEGMPDDHIPQVQGCMFVTGRKWWDFTSFDPRQAPSHRLYIQRIYRDDEYIANLEKQILQFEMELRAMVETLMRKVA